VGITSEWGLHRSGSEWEGIPFELRIVHVGATERTGRYEEVKGASKAGNRVPQSGEESNYGLGVAGDEECDRVEERKEGRRVEERRERERERLDEHDAGLAKRFGRKWNKPTLK
jgi:hypothetical protein